MLAACVSSAAVGKFNLGARMKRTLLTALVVLCLAQPGFAASKSSKNCYSQSAIEAEEAIRFLTDVMVASSACQNTTYAEFRLRNQREIIGYQKAMITHFHGAPAFDRWNTSLANTAAQKQASVPPGQFCQQAEALMKQASALDPNGFRAFAAAQAASAAGRYEQCGGKKH